MVGRKKKTQRKTKTIHKTRTIYRTRQTKNPFGQVTNLAVGGAGAIMASGIALSMAGAFSK